MSNINVSVIMPVYNEEKYIVDCIESMLKQDYPKEKMEWIFVDGQSKDRTCEIIKKYQKKYPELIRLYNNPDKTVPYAMNIGIKHSVGNYIIRLDAHADYPESYFSKCVYYLDTIEEADNVGGIAITKSRTRQGEVIARMLSSKFGVGNSQFRTNGKSGFVDTVPFGAFRRSVFDKLGGYDTRLTRNQDNEMNYRIRKNGGKIYMADDIKLTYYCRDSLKGICKMGYQNGKWNVITTKYVPGTMGVRHFVPFAFVMSLILELLLSVKISSAKYIFISELLIYLFVDSCFSFNISRNVKDFFELIAIYFSFHVSYGFGSLIGLLSLGGKK